jgi:hypothetical protein
MRNWRHWYKPDFWRWWWTTGARQETKAVLFTGGALALGIVGYLSATGMSDNEQVVFTEQVVTVTRTTLVKGKPRVVREVITTRLPAETQMRTIRRNGRTITVAAPGETVTRTTTTTMAGPVRKSVVTKNRMVTVPRDRLVRVTLPGATQPGTTVEGPEQVVTAPGETQTQTVTGPTRTVTAPAQTVTNTQTVTGPTTTVTGPTTTVTGPTTTVTGPTQTVTGPTQTVTQTVTVTVTEPKKP